VSSPETEHIVEARMRLAAPPDTVFRYFTDPARYVRWQGIRAELDPRPGGLFRVWMDATTVASGEYVVVEEPHRLVFTWGWEGDAAVPPGSTTVEVMLDDDGDGTILSLRHAGLPDDDAAARHREGWVHFTERLERVVSGRTDDGDQPMTR
jgi:uncharacterized protein YndB with AHSA1/START domain